MLPIPATSTFTTTLRPYRDRLDLVRIEKERAPVPIVQLACRIVVHRDRNVHLILDVLMDRANGRDLVFQEQSQTSARRLGCSRTVEPLAILTPFTKTQSIDPAIGRRTAWRSARSSGAEALGAVDDCARARIGRARLLALVIRQAQDAEHHQFVDLGRVERVALRLRRDARGIVEDDRRG